MEDFAFHIETEDIRRERAKARELRHTQWWKRRLSKGVCYWCGQLVPPADLTMDHIVPISRGGKSTKGNLIPCCKDCNNRKNQFLPIEWEVYLEHVRNRGDA